MEIKLGLLLKIVLIVFLVSSIVTIFLVYANIQNQIGFFEKACLEKTTAIAQALDASIGSREELNDTSKLQNYIYKLIWLNPDVLKININLPDQEGNLKVIASSDTDIIGTPSNTDNYLSYEKNVVVSKSVLINDIRVMVVITPLHLAGQRVGTYEIVLSMESADRTIAAQVVNTAIYTALGFALIFIFVFFLLRRTVFRPIVELKDAAIKIGKGNLDIKIDLKSKDEIGELASAFNQMVKNLKESRAELREYSKDLEKQVKGRTKELERSKKELEAKVDELEKFTKFSVGRELKMTELKKTIRELGRELKRRK